MRRMKYLRNVVNDNNRIKKKCISALNCKSVLA